MILFDEKAFYSDLTDALSELIRARSNEETEAAWLKFKALGERIRIEQHPNTQPLSEGGPIAKKPIGNRKEGEPENQL